MRSLSRSMGRPEGPALFLAGVCVVAGLAVSADDASVHADLQAHVTTRTASYRDLSAFSFGVYSDIHMIENVDFGLTRTQWAKLLTQWRDAGHLFGMIVGDLGYGNATDPANVLSGPAAVAGAPPVFYVMGNHETDGIGKRAWVDALYPGAVQSASWTTRSGLMPGNGDHVYYSFDVGPSTHFIVLDGDYVTYDGITTTVRQRFGQAQLNWLAADLQANSNRNILVFVHEPIDQQVSGSVPEYTLNDKGGLIDLLAAHPKQAFIFSGHFHSLSGITRWKGVTSVHVMTKTQSFYGGDYYYGVNVSVKGDQISITNAGAVTDFDQHPMNQVQTVGDKQIVSVAEDGANSGLTRNARMSVVGPENGIVPTSGSLMLKGPAMTWYAPRFISEQLVKIRPGMKFSFDMFLLNVVGADDAVTVQPSWYMKDGSMPPRVVDQNGFQLSQRPRDGMYCVTTRMCPGSQALRLAGGITGSSIFAPCRELRGRHISHVRCHPRECRRGVCRQHQVYLARLARDQYSPGGDADEPGRGCELHRAGEHRPDGDRKRRGRLDYSGEVLRRPDAGRQQYVHAVRRHLAKRPRRQLHAHGDRN